MPVIGLATIETMQPRRRHLPLPSKPAAPSSSIREAIIAAADAAGIAIVAEEIPRR